MTVCDYKISDEEKKQAQVLIEKKIPPYCSRIDYFKYFEIYLEIPELQLLCKFFACNISELPQEMSKYQQLHK